MLGIRTDSTSYGLSILLNLLLVSDCLRFVSFVAGRVRSALSRVVPGSRSVSIRSLPRIVLGLSRSSGSSGSSGSSALGLRLELVRSLQRLWRLVGLALRVEVVRLRPFQRLWRGAWRSNGSGGWWGWHSHSDWHGNSVKPTSRHIDHHCYLVPRACYNNVKPTSSNAYRSTTACAPCLLQQREADEQ